MRRDERQRSELPALCRREDTSQRDECLARAAFRNGCGTAGHLESFNDAKNGEHLGWERPALELMQPGRNRIVRIMERRKLAEHSFSKSAAVETQVLRNAIRCTHGDSLSEGLMEKRE